MNTLAVITSRREKINALLQSSKLAASHSELSVNKPLSAAGLSDLSHAVVVEGGGVDLRTNTKIRELQSKIKALEDNLETISFSRQSLENQASSLRNEVKEVKNRAHENEQKILEECRYKDREIQALEVELKQRLQSYRDGCNKESELVSEQMMEEMRLLRAENKTLMDEVVKLTNINSKNLSSLKGLCKLAENQSSDLLASGLRVSQLEAMKDIGSELYSKDRVMDLEGRIQALQIQIQKATTVRDELHELEGEKEICRQTLLDMAKEARDVLGSLLSSAEPADSRASQQNEDTISLGSGKKKRHRQSEDSSHHSAPASTVITNDLQVKTTVHLTRACVYCEDEAYGLMNRCGCCGESFHTSCGTVTAAGFCAGCAVK